MWKFCALNEEQSKGFYCTVRHSCTLGKSVSTHWNYSISTRSAFPSPLCDFRSTCMWHYDETDPGRGTRNDGNDAIFMTHPSANIRKKTPQNKQANKQQQQKIAQCNRCCGQQTAIRGFRQPEGRLPENECRKVIGEVTIQDYLELVRAQCLRLLRLTVDQPI